MDLAMKSGHRDVVKLLIEKGANPYLGNYEKLRRHLGGGEEKEELELSGVGGRPVVVKDSNFLKVIFFFFFFFFFFLSFFPFFFFFFFFFLSFFSFFSPRKTAPSSTISLT